MLSSRLISRKPLGNPGRRQLTVEILNNRILPPLVKILSHIAFQSSSGSGGQHSSGVKFRVRRRSKREREEDHQLMLLTR